jgi:hypothetical protein
VALTMADIALSADSGSENRSRNTHNARHAYDTVLYLSGRFVFTSQEEQELGRKLSTLKAALARLGEEF